MQETKEKQTQEYDRQKTQAKQRWTNYDSKW